MWRVAQFGRALNILVHPLPAKADELGLSIRVREVAGTLREASYKSRSATPINFGLNLKSKI